LLSYISKTTKRNVENIEGFLPSIDIETGSLDFHKHCMKDKNGVAGKVLLNNRDIQFVPQVEESQRSWRSRTRQYKKYSMLEDRER